MSESSSQGLYFEDGLCAICGKPTIRSGWDDLEKAIGIDRDREPFVCSRCLVDLRGDMATELEVRRQITNLQATVTSLNTRVWVLSIRFSVFGIVVGFVLGAAFGGS
jgi:hypothetical protein